MFASNKQTIISLYLRFYFVKLPTMSAVCKAKNAPN